MTAVLRVARGTLDAAELAGLVAAVHLALRASATSASTTGASGRRSVLIPPPFVPPHVWTCREPGRPPAA